MPLFNTPKVALPDGNYFWRVRGATGNNDWEPYSERRTFIKDWTNGGAIVPEPISPSDNSVISAFQNEHFRWNPIPGAATYLLEISTDPAFSGALAYSAETIKPHHTPIKRLSNNDYYWRVTPVDNYFPHENKGIPSQIRKFTFNWDQVPQLLSPDPEVDLAFLPRFSWTDVEGAKKYQLEVSTETDLSNPQIYVTANTDYTPKKALSND